MKEKSSTPVEAVDKSSGGMQRFNFWSRKSSTSEVEDLTVPAVEKKEKKTFRDRFNFFKKTVEVQEEEVATELGSEDVFSNNKRKINANAAQLEINGKKSKTKHESQNVVSLDDFIRIKVWVRKTRNEPFLPAKFCGCLVDYFAGADERNVFSAPPINFHGSHSRSPSVIQSGRETPQHPNSTNSNLHIPQNFSFSKRHSVTSSVSTLRITDPNIRSGHPSRLMSPFIGCCGSGLATPSGRSALSTASTSTMARRHEAMSVTVECILQDNRVLLQPAPLDDLPDRYRSKMRRIKNKPGASVSYIAVLEHPPFCCAHRISPRDKMRLSDESIKRGVDVGVAVLLESSDGKIFVTRRAEHMRTFPGVWVPPGGHIEDGESILKAGMREVREETGLELREGRGEYNRVYLMVPQEETQEEESEEEDYYSYNFFSGEGRAEESRPISVEAIELDDPDYNRYCVLGLWESCYPPVLYAGRPKRQHLVYYLHINLSRSAEEINKLIKLDPTEVGASAWLDRSAAEVVAHSGRTVPYSTIDISVVDPETGDISPAVIDVSVLRKKMPLPDREIERLTTGTRYAIKLWLTMKEEDAPMTPHSMCHSEKHEHHIDHHGHNNDEHEQHEDDHDHQIDHNEHNNDEHEQNEDDHEHQMDDHERDTEEVNEVEEDNSDMDVNNDEEYEK